AAAIGSVDGRTRRSRAEGVLRLPSWCSGRRRASRTSTGMSTSVADLGLTPPEPLELVSADEATAIIDETRADLDSLEARAAESRRVADAVEARAAEEGADERASTWAIVRLQRFIDGLRAEAEHDAETVVEAARRGAREQAEVRDAEERLLRDAPV